MPIIVLAWIIGACTSIPTATLVPTQVDTLVPTQLPTRFIQPTSTPIRILFEKNSLWKLHIISDQGGGPDGVRLADFNNDGLLDITTSFESSGNVQLFLHPGKDKLAADWPYVIVGNVPRGEDAFGMDVDGNGVLDVVSAHEGDTLGMYVHWGPLDPSQTMNPEAWQTELIPSTQGKAWLYAIPFDINLDGNLDIVLGAKDDYYNDRNAVGDIGWLEAPFSEKHNLTNWIYHSMDHAGWPMSVAAQDVDVDGDFDILVTDRNSDEEHMGARWLENPGENWDQEWKSHFFSGLQGSRPGFMSSQDFDTDGSVDYAFSLLTENYFALVDGRSGQQYTVELSGLDEQIGSQKGVQAGDLNKDGSSDLVFTFVGGQIGVGWISLKAPSLPGVWVWNTIYQIEDGKFDQPILYDVDQDGDLDILSTEEIRLGIIWFENPIINVES